MCVTHGKHSIKVVYFTILLLYYIFITMSETSGKHFFQATKNFPSEHI
jgi:hypothetical protein